MSPLVPCMFFLLEFRLAVFHVEACVTISSLSVRSDFLHVAVVIGRMMDGN